MNRGDFLVGAKLICVGHTVSGNYKVGELYEVTEIEPSRWYKYLIGTGEWFSFDELRGKYGPQPFLPLARLSEKEQFTFHMTGKIPERLV